jgi:hypothetical protein
LFIVFVGLIIAIFPGAAGLGEWRRTKDDRHYGKASDVQVIKVSASFNLISPIVLGSSPGQFREIAGKSWRRKAYLGDDLITD